MNQLTNNFESNLESKQLEEQTNILDTINTDENNDYNNLKEDFENSKVIASASTNTIDTTKSSIDDNNSDSSITNCLALTVKKDYSLSIVKNVVVKTLKNIWRVAVSIFTLNLIKFFL